MDQIILFCCCSDAQLCPTLCDPMDWSMPGFPVLHHLPELAEAHVHWVGGAIQPSRPLSSPSPPAFNPSQHQGLLSGYRLVSLINDYAVFNHSVMSDSLWPHGLWPTRLLCPRGFSRQEYWSGLPCPPPGDLPNPGIKPSSSHCRWILHHLSHWGSPRTLGWVACSFSRGSSKPRNWTGISCIAGGFFSSWATKEALLIVSDGIR